MAIVTTKPELLHSTAGSVVIHNTGVGADLRDNCKRTPSGCEIKSGRRIVMNKLLFALSAATLLVVGSAAFAGPAEEAAQDYPGWRAATHDGIVGFPEDTNLRKGQVIRTPNNVGR
jgi:hypothetical protein